MFYRTNDLVHGIRVARTIRESLNPLLVSRFGSAYDPLKAEIMGAIHDDHEELMKMGDVQAGIKALMSAIEKAAVESDELFAIHALAKRRPALLGGYSYQGLILEGIACRTLEAQAVKVADKFDAYGEAMHELYAGNIEFATNRYRQGEKILLPPETYVDFFEHLAQKCPDLAFLTQETPAWIEPRTTDWRSLAGRGQLHTAQDLLQPTGYQPYDLWKSIHRKYPDEVHLLTTQLEFPTA